EAYRAPFRELARTMPAEGLLVLFADDPECVALGEHAACRVETYGATVTADWCILDTTPATGDELQRFSVLHQPGDERFDVLLSVPGSHNRQNAVAALALARFAGARLEPCLDACRSFKGASRRFEIVGTAGGVTVVDDYAHHPTEVAVTVAAARQRFPGRRLLVVDVPHTYSRTLEFLDDYGDVFAGAEVVILGPIEAARERHLSTTVSSADIAGRVRTGGVKSLVVDSSDAALTTVIERAQPGDVVLCISVGGFDGLAQRLLVSLGERHGGG